MTSIEVEGNKLLFTITKQKVGDESEEIVLGLNPPGSKFNMIPMSEDDLYRLDYAIQKFKMTQALEVLSRVKKGERPAWSTQ